MSLLHNSKHKLRNIYRTIDRLDGSDFPLRSGSGALFRLRQAFAKLEKNLDRAVRAKDASAIRQVASNINLKVYQALPILGFILRSTNVRNAFELLEPLQSISEAAMQGSPALILSSEWDYVPFAYPQSLDDLKSFVLIGLPASEAASALLVPIAGHEIGHAVWRNRGIEGSVVATIQYHCEEVYNQNLQRFRRVFVDYREDDIVAREILPEAIAESVGYAVRQAEEIYCDLFAYAVFGASYVHAFAYLLSPGTGNVDSKYPSNATRISAIRDIATREGALVPEFKDLGFTAEVRAGNNRHKFILEMAESGVEKITPGLWTRVSEVVKDRIIRPSEALANRHFKDFKLGIPSAVPVCIGDIINAGWLFHADVVKTDRNPKSASDKLDLLNELLLKTIEVLEFNKRVRDADV